MADSFGLTRAAEHWTTRMAAHQMSPSSVARYQRVYEAFERFATASGCPDLTGVDEFLCRRFVHAPRADGGAPATSTSRFRLTVIRAAFEVLLDADNPTAGMAISQTSQSRSPVPLTPLEAARLRASGRISPKDTLRPAAVELALLGGTHPEIAAANVANVDLDRSRVQLGSRWADLDMFAAMTLRSRIAACRRNARRRSLPWDPARTSIALTRPLETYPSSSIAPGISSSLSRALSRAGIARPGVRAASIREFTLNCIYAMNNRVEDVADFLGIDSLDTAMGYIDHEWQRQYAAQVRR